jgi:hypothetical protein
LHFTFFTPSVSLFTFYPKPLTHSCSSAETHHVCVYLWFIRVSFFANSVFVCRSHVILLLHF